MLIQANEGDHRFRILIHTYVRPNAHYRCPALALKPLQEDAYARSSTILYWISKFISSDESSGRLTFYLRPRTTDNATRLLDLMRKSFSIALTRGKNQSDLEHKYLAFVADVCWQRLRLWSKSHPFGERPNPLNLFED